MLAQHVTASGWNLLTRNFIDVAHSHAIVKSGQGVCHFRLALVVLPFEIMVST
jgi:hypothetical protein